MGRENAWKTYDDKDMKRLESLSSEYMVFLNNGKTERECTELLIKMAEDKGYKNLADVIAAGEKLQVGSKVYANNMGKAVMMLNIGDDIVNKGMNILGAHIDSPRLDLKQQPLYENDDLAYFDTHYYGGIKKYQWVALPLALHGVVCKPDGTTIKINIGEDENDPVFYITDLLIHLADAQMKKSAREVIDGEKLDLLVGSIPLKDEEEKAIRKGVLKILKDKYDIDEDDFISAEIEAVPAGKARELGFDRSLIAAYGHDDRCCAYPSAVAMLEVEHPAKTTCGLFVDKEEIGSVGATGMESHFFEDTMREILNLLGCYDEINLTRCLHNCKMLSSDVNAAFDPMYSEAFEKYNSSMAGYGLVFCKFTGARGKSGSNDANAEYLADLRRMMDKHNVHYQVAELGKVDIGGGGTIAYILSLYGMQVIDSGIAVFSMHAPWEAISKADLYEAYKGYKAFLIEG